LPGTHKRWHLLQRHGLGQTDRVLGKGSEGKGSDVGSAVLTYSKGRLTFTQFENPWSGRN